MYSWDEMMGGIKAESAETKVTVETAEAIAKFLSENDYVPVVRCIDCVHSFTTKGGGRYCAMHPDPGWPGHPSPVDDYQFCWHGRRVKDEG